MVKKILIYVFVFLLTFLSVYVIVKKSKKSTLAGKDNNFAIEDTSTIDKFRITEKSGKEVTISRGADRVWMVNGKYPARMNAITLLLYTFKMAEVKFPAAETMRPNIFRTMASVGSKVEIFQNGERVRIWVIGSETPDLNGTFMLLADAESGENYEVPYIVNIPGFQGILNSRFFTNEADWRDRTILAVSPYDIASINFKAIEYPDSSFSIQVNDLKRYDIKVADGKGNIFSQFDSLAVKQYLAYFLNLSCEKYFDDSLTVSEDSVKRVGRPFVNLTVKTKNGQENVFNFFHKEPEKGKEEEFGVKFTFDPNYVYIKSNNNKDFSIGQVLQYGKILQTRRYFASKFVKK